MREEERERETLMDGSGDGEIELSETNQSGDIKREREIGGGFLQYLLQCNFITLQVAQCTFPFLNTY